MTILFSHTLRRRSLPAAFVPLLLLLPFTAAADDPPGLAALEEQAMRAAVRRAAPFIVKIETVGGLERVEGLSDSGLTVGDGPTTGVIVSSDGYILSSAFNFIRQPTAILVTLPGETARKAAKIVARDHHRKLVLLKVDADKPLSVPEAVPLDELTVGEWALALGRTFDSELPNMSIGILSALDRVWGTAVQTDAKVSPSNYGGPLIDIQGRVIGILSPLSPQQQEEVAGAEWYDSGIGFAVPLAEIQPRLEKMKQGEDLHRGLLGVTLAGSDIYGDPAKIGVCHPTSPAAKAGLKAEDTIVEINGTGIARQAQLKHIVGALYAGDEVEVVALRGKDKERITSTFELAAELIPYEHPFLGVLPRRHVASPVAVRWLYPGAPAEEAGIKQGDVLLSLGDDAIESDDQLRTLLARLQPKEKAKLKLRRGEKEQTVEVTLASLPTDVPEAPAADLPDGDPPADGAAATGVIEIVIPEEKNKCTAYVPPNYRADAAFGLVVYLPAPGDFNFDEVQKRWQTACADRGLIVLTVQPEDDQRWRASEAAVIRKAIDTISTDYSIDATRIVTFGEQSGGAMAYLSAFEHRELIRGVAVIDASVPSRVRVPSNDPLHRLAIYSAVAAKSAVFARVEQSLEQLREQNYPVTARSLGDEPRDLNDEEFDELLRWIDALDRI